MKSLTKPEIIKNIIDDVEKDLSNEDIIHLILGEKVSSNETEGDETFGQKAADNLASFAGSWVFIIGFATILTLWIIINEVMSQKAFDPYPFILLNLVLSCVAAIQAPLIMMSQNRKDSKDRQRAENDYKVNLKTEIIIQDLHQKLDIVLENQKFLMKEHVLNENQ